MATDKLTVEDLKREIDDLESRNPRLDHPELFVAWFLRAFVTADEGSAIAALCGGSGDKAVDAVLIDDDSHKVFIVQGKYRSKVMDHAEKRSDVLNFSHLAEDLSGEAGAFETLGQKLSPDVQARLKKARDKILQHQYALMLYYVTTGKASAALKEEARRGVRSVKECSADFEFVDGNRVLALLDYYLRDVAPPVASLDLAMESGNGVEIHGVFHRYDSKLDIESWVFSMTGREVADMFDKAGPRLFALNIRGYQGDTSINKGMEETLEKSPEYFWYYNNGLTVVCDDARKITTQGRDVLQVSSPQVINGQQTTRTLWKMASRSPKASVTVRVIRVPHTMEANSDHFDTLVSQIVKSTNWQNYIVPSDLIANDRRQIEIHRQLRNLGYWYVRKRQTKGEARREAASRQYRFINKTELAQAVAGCEMDPSIVRRGKERLFQEKLYGLIFPTNEPYFYLKRYWLMKEVEVASKGYPERAYAKWLVLNFMWGEVSSCLESRARRNVFEQEWKARRGDTVDFLWKAITEVFKAAISFYRLNKGKGDRAADVSTFFQHVNLHTEFAAYWASSKSKYKNRFMAHMARFQKALNQGADL